MRMLAIAIGLSLAAVPASAHHSFAMFDSAKVVTLKGTITQFNWTNPHVSIFLDVNGTIWGIELTSPGNLTRGGWNRNIIKVGDKVEVEVNPLRDGKPGGGFRQMTLASGQVLRSRLIEVEAKPAS
jgi:hypothetical protein